MRAPAQRPLRVQIGPYVARGAPNVGGRVQIGPYVARGAPNVGGRVQHASLAVGVAPIAAAWPEQPT